MFRFISTTILNVVSSRTTPSSILYTTSRQWNYIVCLTWCSNDILSRFIANLEGKRWVRHLNRRQTEVISCNFCVGPTSLFFFCSFLLLCNTALNIPSTVLYRPAFTEICYIVTNLSHGSVGCPVHAAWCKKRCGYWNAEWTNSQ